MRKRLTEEKCEVHCSVAHIHIVHDGRELNVLHIVNVIQVVVVDAVEVYAAEVSSVGHFGYVFPIDPQCQQVVVKVNDMLYFKPFIVRVSERSQAGAGANLDITYSVSTEEYVQVPVASTNGHYVLNVVVGLFASWDVVHPFQFVATGGFVAEFEHHILWATTSGSTNNFERLSRRICLLDRNNAIFSSTECAAPGGPPAIGCTILRQILLCQLHRRNILFEIITDNLVRVSRTWHHARVAGVEANSSKRNVFGAYGDGTVKAAKTVTYTTSCLAWFPAIRSVFEFVLVCATFFQRNGDAPYTVALIGHELIGETVESAGNTHAAWINSDQRSIHSECHIMYRCNKLVKFQIVHFPVVFKTAYPAELDYH